MIAPGNFTFMNKLLTYYQRELSFLKHQGKLFAAHFPKIARRLGIVDGESEDPHVSRLVESFALLTSRIHQRLDEDVPELIEALLCTLAPQFLRPMPSCCIVSFTADPLKSGITGKNILPANTTLFTRQRVPVSCQFQTVYPVNLLPLSVSEAGLRFDSDALRWELCLQLKVWPGARLADDPVRIYLHGPANATSTIYALLCSEISALTLTCKDDVHYLPPDAIKPVGFEAEEALITRDPRILPVHILMLDYFCFPQKFSFVDLLLPSGFFAGGNEILELRAVFQRTVKTDLLTKLTQFINPDFFRLHCAPAINLFRQRAEPISLTDATAEYPLIPDTRSQSWVDVWAVEQVYVQRKVENRIEQYPVSPLLDTAFVRTDQTSAGLSWQTFYRETVGASGHERKAFIAFSEQRGRAVPDHPEIITLSMLCTNNTVPCAMQYGQPEGDFDIEAPVAGLNITAMTPPAQPVQPPGRNDARWRFLSLLSLNHQLLSGEDGAQRLKEILALYRFDDCPGNSDLYNLIKTISCKPVSARLKKNDPHSLVRGIEITLIFQQEAQHDPDWYLLCSFLDRLLALYAPVNSFSRLTTSIEKEPKSHRVWPLRAGKLSWL